MNHKTAFTPELGPMIQRWYRGAATDTEREALLAARYLRVTRTGHVEATNKGFRTASRLNGVSHHDIKQAIEQE